MQYLLDTHTFIWFIDDVKTLSQKAAKEIAYIENDCFLSIASLWEIAIKCNIGKLQLKSSFHDITYFLADNNIRILPLEFRHLQTLLSLELIHRDPFDRIIIAQAITDDLTIITMDKHFPGYPVKCTW